MQIRITDLLCCSPFEFGVWLEKPLTAHEVRAAIYANQLDARSWDTLDDEEIPDERSYHIERVAYLVLNPDPTPVYINAGYGHYSPSSWPLQDGHHRLAAAIYRGDTFIEANITGHSKWIQKLFGIDLSEVA